MACNRHADHIALRRLGFPFVPVRRVRRPVLVVKFTALAGQVTELNDDRTSGCRHGYRNAFRRS